MPPFVPITAHGKHPPPPDIFRDGSFTYTPPKTTFFEKDGPSMTLRDMSTYAEAERLNQLMRGGFLEYAAKIPLIGRLLYSPGGAAVVERANQTGDNRNATGRAFRAGVFSPATAILGLGTMREDEMGAVNAGNGHPIMAGKSLYFLLTAGVSADHVTVRTPFTVAHVEMYIEELAHGLVEELKSLSPKESPQKIPEGQEEQLIKELVQNAKSKFIPDSGRDAILDKHRFVPWTKNIREELVDSLLRNASSFLGDESQNEKLKENVSNRGWDMLEKIRAIEFANHIVRVGHLYSFINVEDSKGKWVPLIIKILKEDGIQATVWCDDIQGTGIIMGAGTLTWAKKHSKELSDVRVAFTGAGAGTYGVRQEYINLGVKPENIRVFDTGEQKARDGRVFCIWEGRKDIADDPIKVEMARGITEDIIFEEWMKGTDILVNLGDPKVVTRDLEFTERIIRGMASHPLVVMATNPDPGIKSEWLTTVRPDAEYASGNQLYKNTMNNFTAFGYVALGAMWAGASHVNKEMTVAAMHAISHIVSKMDVPDHVKKEGGEAVDAYKVKWNLVPHPEDMRLITEQSVAVAVAAYKSGNSIYCGTELPNERQVEHFKTWVHKEAERTAKRIQLMRKVLPQNAEIFFKENFPELYAPLYLGDKLFGQEMPVFWAVPQNSLPHFRGYSEQLGVEPKRIEAYVKGNELDPRKLTEVITELHHRSKGGKSEFHQAAQKEVRIIVDIAGLNPAMALALGVRRLQLWDNPSEMKYSPTLFHLAGVEEIVNKVVEKAQKSIGTFKAELAPHMEKTEWNSSIDKAISNEKRRQAYAKSYKSQFEWLSTHEGRAHYAASFGGMFAWELVSAFVHQGDVRTNLLRSSVGLAEFMALDHGWKFLLRRSPLVSLLAPALAAATISVGTDVATGGLDSLTEWNTWKRAGIHAFTGGLVFVSGSRVMGNITQRALATGIKGYIKPIVGNLAVGITSFTSVGAGSLASEGASYLLDAEDQRIGVQA